MNSEFPLNSDGMLENDVDTLAVGFVLAKTAPTKIQAGIILAEIVKLMAVMSASEIETAKVFADATIATQEEDSDAR